MDEVVALIYSIYLFIKNLRMREYSAHHCEWISIGENMQLCCFHSENSLLSLSIEEFSHSQILEKKEAQKSFAEWLRQLK